VDSPGMNPAPSTSATGMSALEYAQERLFGLLGIADVEWPSSPEGTTIGYSQLHLRPHDGAKIGFLYLNGGQWNGQQVVPAVKSSTRLPPNPNGVASLEANIKTLAEP